MSIKIADYQTIQKSMEMKFDIFHLQQGRKNERNKIETFRIFVQTKLI